MLWRHARDLSDACAGVRAPVDDRSRTGRGSRDSFVRSVAVRPNAEGGGLARRPGARVRGWVGDGADVWRYQFGSQCVGNERTRGRKLRLRGYELTSHFWPITNSRVLESDDRS